MRWRVEFHAAFLPEFQELAEAVQDELAAGVWRLAYGFDPERKAILLVAGDKSGGSQARFYKALIRKADDRFDGHLADLAKRRSHR